MCVDPEGDARVSYLKLLFEEEEEEIGRLRVN
jgi:hypothetical protein